MTTKKQEVNKPIFDTIVNTAAIAMTAAGTGMTLKGEYYGFILIGVGVALELVKYLRRKYL